MSRKAIIDVGSNSIKFFLGERNPDGTLKTVMDENDIARLGEGLRETGAISPEAMRRNSGAISIFAEKAREHGADEIACVGTMALRNATNSTEFVNLVEEVAGLKLRIIPGEEEARLAYLSVLSGLTLQGGKLAVFDTGGGSTEFIFGEGNTVSSRFSLDIGAIRITEKYFADTRPEQSDVNAAIAEIDSALSAVSGDVDQLVGMGGTLTSMGAVKHKMARYDPDVIQGSVLTFADVDRQIEDYSSKTAEERKGIIGLQPKRADVILAGACIVKVIMSRLGVDKLTVSDRGLRHGLAFEMLVK